MNRTELHSGRLRLVCIALIFTVMILQPMASYCIYAQNSPVKVTVSKKKQVIDGQTYYLHTVKKGETLFSIANAYGVLQKDIVAANPNAFTGIRIGEELRIPAPGEKETYEGKGLESDRFVFYVAKEGQQKEDISRQYGVSLDTLYKFNPELQYAPIDPGQVIVIPKGGAGTEDLAAPGSGTVIHRVEASETLYAISRKYGVSVNDILEANPDIDSRTLRIQTGQSLRIPSEANPIALPLVFRQTDTVVVRKDTLTEPGTDTGIASFDNISFNTAGTDFRSTFRSLFDRRTLRIALLIPLFLEENTFLESSPEELAAQTPQLYDRSLNFLEFYQGFLTAMYDLRQQGYEIELHTFDTGRDVNRLDDILRRPEMQQMDLFIGPFYSDMLGRMNAFARNTQTCFVSPLTENTSLLRNNPYMLQFFPDSRSTQALMLDYLKRQQDAQIVFVRNTAESMSTADFSFLQQLQEQCPGTLTLAVPAERRAIFPAGYFAGERRYIFVTPSSDELFASNLMSQLNVASQGRDILLCGPESWIHYVNIDLDYSHTLQFRYTAPFFIDRNQNKTQEFLHSYRDLFRTEPFEMLSKGYNYAFLGYDIATYFVPLLRKYGKDFASALPQEASRMLQSDVFFERTGDGDGFVNRALRMVRYTDDYYLVQETGQERPE
ncbi:MAG: LysM peptidoglycan-binding domain-containing protein [Bacteroidales bacterium]|nr:LysM peptidoglycan-binding domain-containing protein [Bacteroidales bacterium]